MRAKRQLRLLCALAVTAALLSVAPRAGADGDDTIRAPGVHLLMRHALAPGTGDPDGFTPGDCSTQRNLSAGGRLQAARTGDRLRAAGILPDRVLTSRWCRCRETADLLALGPAADTPAIDSFFRAPARKQRQTAQTIDLLRAATARGEKLLLVTHQVNITALTGVFPKSGEILAVKVTQEGPRVVARLDPSPVRDSP